METGSSTPRGAPWETILGVVGIIAYLATGLLYVAGGLVVPAPWLLALWAVWFVGLYLVVRVYQARRAWTPLLAVAAVAAWWLFVTIGESLFGWTA